MTAADGDRFSELLLALSETFKEPISETRAGLYFDALSDLSIEQLEQAVRLALRRSKFFPRPAELLDLVTGSPEEQADEAWAAVLDAVRRVGAYKTPALEESAMETVRRLFGTWSRCCQQLPAGGPELLGWRKTFIAAHQQSHRRREVAALLAAPALAGLLPEGSTVGPRSMPEARGAAVLPIRRKVAR